MNPCDITLYGIIDPERTNGAPLPDLASASVDNGVSLIQYRDKHSDIREMIANARAIQHAIKGTNVPFIVNDRVDVALACEADGVHLGQEDMPVEDARNLLGQEAIIGISIKTLCEAKACPVEIIDYAFVGGVYDTQSKDNPAAIGIDGWIERANIIKNLSAEMPVGAIAGIDETNIQELFAAGCDGVAIISSLYMADDVHEAAKNLSRLIGEVQT